MHILNVSYEPFVYSTPIAHYCLLYTNTSVAISAILDRGQLHIMLITFTFGWYENEMNLNYVYAVVGVHCIHFGMMLTISEKQKCELRCTQIDMVQLFIGIILFGWTIHENHSMTISHHRTSQCSLFIRSLFNLNVWRATCVKSKWNHKRH